MPFQQNLLILVLLVLFSCGEGNSEKERSLEEIKIKDPVRKAQIIRDPSETETSKDTIHVAQMTFDTIRYRYGEVEEGTIVRHAFRFVNTGKVPLVISSAKSTCGCTVPKWPRDPVPVGGEGVIRVEFDTENKEAYQTKPIFITANTHPPQTTIYLMGKVRKQAISVNK